MKKEAISEDLKNLKYEDLLDDKGEINPFAIDNLQMKREYMLITNQQKTYTKPTNVQESSK